MPDSSTAFRSPAEPRTSDSRPNQALHAVPRPRQIRPRTAPPAAPLTRDPAMRDLLVRAARLAATDLPVLIQGESGTGKEVIAQFLSAASARSQGPLISANCAAIPDSLAESILFGHVRGAFTGADRDQTGLFVQADGGTLFLDEIGDMSAADQARLLRVLDEGRVRPVGSQRSVVCDVRILCATNHDLSALVREGRFRADLYYRLAGATLSLPALRERAVDVELLASRFLAELAEQHGTERRFAPSLVRRMQSHSWPGNVRELRNWVTSAYHLADGLEIDCELPDAAAGRRDVAQAGRLVTRLATLAEIERDAIELALTTVNGDRREAAKRLGISRSTLYVRIRDLGL